MKKICLSLLLLIPLIPLHAQDSTKFITGKPWLNIWAMANLDVIHDLNQMDPDWIGGFRPSKIPIHPSDPGWGSRHNTYFSLRQSTFKFEGVLPTNHRWGPMRLRFEFDLFGMGVQAGETTFRLRLVYGDWGPIRIGKDWSTFIDLACFPNNFEWWGPSGMALLPSVMLRYTQQIDQNNILEYALEMPGSEIDPGHLRQIDPVLFHVQAKEMIPDLITRYTHQGSWGHFRAAAMLRMLSYDVISQINQQAETHHRFGWAVNLTSNLYVFDKKGLFNLQTVFGHGYAGYNNDGGVEITPDADFHAVVPFQYGFVAFYNHFFGDHWSASLGCSGTHQHNTPGQMNNAFNHSLYSVTQVIYNVFQSDILQFGFNYQYGKKFEKDGSSAHDQRLMFTARFQINHVKKEP
jgi:hypothetical protein